MPDSNLVILMTLLVIAVHLVQFYLRNIYFYRSPVVNEGNLDPFCVRSPVEGRVVYVNKVLVSSLQENPTAIVMNKEGRIIRAPRIPGGRYLQVGIFMSPMDNHHMVSPMDKSFPVTMYYDENLGTLNSMWDQSDGIFIWKWFRNWFDKKISTFIDVNNRTVFRLANGITLVMIYDKYVSKLTRYSRVLPCGRPLLGFVHRGSQCDLFIPLTPYDENNMNMFIVAEGSMVSFDSIIIQGIKF